MAEHHDGFSMWDSEVTPWNVADMGPKKDITGELAKALKKRDMKLITTFHHAKQLQRFDSTETGSRTEGYELSHYPFFEGMPTRSDDEKLKVPLWKYSCGSMVRRDLVWKTERGH